MKRLDLDALPPVPAPGQRQQWGGLQGPAPGLVLSRAALAYDGLSLVITENTRQAERLLEELGFFLGEKDVICHKGSWIE